MRLSSCHKPYIQQKYLLTSSAGNPISHQFFVGCSGSKYHKRTSITRYAHYAHSTQKTPNPKPFPRSLSRAVYKVQIINPIDDWKRCKTDRKHDSWHAIDPSSRPSILLSQLLTLEADRLLIQLRTIVSENLQSLEKLSCLRLYPKPHFTLMTYPEHHSHFRIGQTSFVQRFFAASRVHVDYGEFDKGKKLKHDAHAEPDVLSGSVADGR